MRRAAHPCARRGKVRAHDVRWGGQAAGALAEGVPRHTDQCAPSGGEGVDMVGFAADKGVRMPSAPADLLTAARAWAQDRPGPAYAPSWMP